MGGHGVGRRKSRELGQTAWELRQVAREDLWRARVAAWRLSGLSQAAFCRQQDLAPTDFSWWKHELARRDGRRALTPVATDATAANLAAANPAAKSPAPSSLEPGGFADVTPFVPLRIAAVHPQGSCALKLRNGRRLRIDGGADPRWVAELAAALEGLAPC